MRTTIDLPDPLFRRTKAMAALRGTTMKELITRALEREIAESAPPKRKPHRVKLPLIPWKGKKKLDLSNFDFDELLG
jgi:hypothetical protein